MFEDYDKILWGVAAVVVLGVVLAVAKMLPSQSVEAAPLPVSAASFSESQNAPSGTKVLKNAAPVSPTPASSATMVTARNPAFVPAPTFSSASFSSPGEGPHSVVIGPESDLSNSPARTGTMHMGGRVEPRDGASASAAILLPPTTQVEPLLPVNVRPATALSSLPGQSSAPWTEIPGGAGLWVSQPILQPHTFRLGGRAVFDTLSRKPGVWIYRVGVFNAGSRAIWLTPDALRFADNSLSPLFHWGGDWGSFSPEGGFENTAAGITPIAALDQTILLPPGAETHLLLFAGAEPLNPAPGAGVRLASTTNLDTAGDTLRRPEGILLLVTSNPGALAEGPFTNDPARRLREHADLVRQLDSRTAGIFKVETLVPTDQSRAA